MIFLGGVGIVHPQITAAGVFPGYAEVQTDSFQVPHVQITVGFRGETGHNSIMPPGLQIIHHDLPDKVQPCGGFRSRSSIDRPIQFRIAHIPAHSL